jgi:hypothetical protein
MHARGIGRCDQSHSAPTDFHARHVVRSKIDVTLPTEQIGQGSESDARHASCHVRQPRDHMYCRLA